MKRKGKVIISIVTVIVLLFNASFSITNAIDTHKSWDGKISEELNAKMTESSDDDLISVIVWFDDIDTDSINSKVETELGYTQEDIIVAETTIPNIKESVFSLEGTAYTNAIKKYEEETESERKIVSNMQNKFTQKRRQLAKEAYIQHNTKNKANLDIDTECVDYISRFSPTILLTITKAQIAELAKKENVVSINCCNDSEPIESISYALPAVKADYTRDTLGLDGSGVKIGMFELGVVGTDSELNSDNITIIDSNTATVADHATFVATIMVGSNGVAPNANLVSGSFSTNDFFGGVEDLVEAGVSVINMSFGYSRLSTDQYYCAEEQWLDHIVFEHKVSVVVSAGNGGVSGIVTPPGLAYNVITVGGTDPQNTISLSDDTLYSGSCSGNGGTVGCAKPDFLAPARVNDVYGTSCSAPIVTGIIAQMIDYKPSISTNPELIKAILTVSTDKKVLPGTDGTTEAWETTITAQQGAGQINAKRALSTLSNGKYSTGTISSGTISKTFSVTSSDVWIRCSVAWIRSNSVLSDHTTSSVLLAPAPNLRLHIYNPSGTSVGSSNITTSSVELVHFTVATTGTYTAKVTRMDSYTDSFRYAIAGH